MANRQYGRKNASNINKTKSDKKCSPTKTNETNCNIKIDLSDKGEIQTGRQRERERQREVEGERSTARHTQKWSSNCRLLASYLRLPLPLACAPCGSNLDAHLELKSAKRSSFSCVFVCVSVCISMLGQTNYSSQISRLSMLFCICSQPGRPRPLRMQLPAPWSACLAGYTR